jgi:hypothetical protein
VRTILAVLAVSSLIVVTGCGGTENSASSAAKQTQGTSTCGSHGYVFTLHGISCEFINAIAVMLDGRSRHQTLTVSGEHWEATWVCNSDSIVGPMECRRGNRYFKMHRIDE